MKSHAFRLAPGQDLYLELKEFIVTRKIEACCILNLIGSLSQLSIRFAAQETESLYVEDFEILSVQGTLSYKGMHLHGVFAKKDGSLLGGHVKPGCLVRTTAEVILIEFPDWVFQRKQDLQTGYLELFPTQKET